MQELSSSLAASKLSALVQSRTTVRRRIGSNTKGTEMELRSERRRPRRYSGV